MDQIAVYTREGELAPFYDCNMVTIYEKQENGWKPAREASFAPIKGTTVKEQREEVQNTAAFAEGAKAILCKEINGIPYSVFDRKGYGIFCTEEADEDTFDGVLSDLEESDEKKRIRVEMVKNAGPAQTQTPGIYFLNLLELQKECPEISSKKALTAFFSNTPFLELHLVCAHIPPWLSMDSAYEKKIRKEEGGLYVTITKSRC